MSFGFYVEDRVLLHKWAVSPDRAEWSSVYQVVFPAEYWASILNLAHDKAMTGCLGITKTYIHTSSGHD